MPAPVVLDGQVSEPGVSRLVAVDVDEAVALATS